MNKLPKIRTIEDDEKANIAVIDLADPFGLSMLSDEEREEIRLEREIENDRFETIEVWRDKFFKTCASIVFFAIAIAVSIIVSL